MGQSCCRCPGLHITMVWTDQMGSEEVLTEGDDAMVPVKAPWHQLPQWGPQQGKYDGYLSGHHWSSWWHGALTSINYLSDKNADGQPKGHHWVANAMVSVRVPWHQLPQWGPQWSQWWKYRQTVGGLHWSGRCPHHHHGINYLSNGNTQIDCQEVITEVADAMVPVQAPRHQLLQCGSQQPFFVKKIEGDCQEVLTEVTDAQTSTKASAISVTKIQVDSQEVITPR